MAGHSKWANIKHKKAAVDAKKAKVFTKILKEITVAVKLGGSDKGMNPRLRLILEKAKNENLSKENIEKAIKRAGGEDKDKDYFEMVYEGYGPGGVAIIVECLTDNKNRTASEVRSTFNKFGGNLGESGCVSYFFQKKGVIFYDRTKYTEDLIMEKALDLGAEEVEDNGENIEVVVPQELYLDFLEDMKKNKIEESGSDLINISSNEVELKGEKAQEALKLIDKLEDLDDVQSVSFNLVVLE